MRRSIVGFAAAACLALTCSAFAGEMAPGLGVPPAGGVSSPNLLGSFFDTSRLHVSNAFVFSSGFGSGAAASSRGMAFTTLSYDVSSPLSASVTFGNRLIGAPRWQGDSGRMTLESLALKYKPNNNLSVTINMAGRDPLLYQTRP